MIDRRKLLKDMRTLACETGVERMHAENRNRHKRFTLAAMFLNSFTTVKTIFFTCNDDVVLTIDPLLSISRNNI